MFTKAVVVLFFLTILYSLGSALFFLVKHDRKNTTRMVAALSWRIALSLLLFFLLLFGYGLGWISPHEI